MKFASIIALVFSLLNLNFLFYQMTQNAIRFELGSFLFVVVGLNYKVLLEILLLSNS